MIYSNIYAKNKKAVRIMIQTAYIAKLNLFVLTILILVRNSHLFWYIKKYTKYQKSLFNDEYSTSSFSIQEYFDLIPKY